MPPSVAPRVWSTRSMRWLFVIVVLMLHARAHAEIAAGPPVPRATLPKASWAVTGDVLPVSTFDDVTIAGRQVDVLGRHPEGPGPVLVPAAAGGKNRRELASTARTYASLGFVTVLADFEALPAVASAPLPELAG